MDIKDILFEFLKDLLSSGGIAKKDRVGVRGIFVYNNYNSCVCIRLVKGASNVQSE